MGWIICGEIHSTSSQQVKGCTFTTITCTERTDILNNNIKKFWEMEEVPIEIPESIENKYCENIFINNVKICPDRRYSVKLPFINGEDPVLGDSKYIALRRFHNLEKKLEKGADLKKAYHETFSDYLEKGHMVPCSPSTSLEKSYYLPHHAVFKHSSTTQVRVVFDASCKTTDGTSLNDLLYKGPKLQNDITDVIFKWRNYKIAFVADVSQMYRQFWIDEQHQEYQRVLWRFKRSDPISEYKLTTVTFGVSSAPYLAIRLLHHIANQEIALIKYPLAVKACKE